MAAITTNITMRLQWGRASMGAEAWAGAVRRPDAEALQWGRASMGAEAGGRHAAAAQRPSKNQAHKPLACGRVPWRRGARSTAVDRAGALAA